MVFTRTSEHEAQVKNFDPKLGQRGNKKIADRLIWNAILTAQRTRLPIHTSYSTSQRGNTFGERLANAIEDTFAMGYDQVITMGNDCPDLTPETLLEVRNRLFDSEMVLGPTPDGGTYLIGLSKEAYHRERFIKMRWQSEWLLEDFESYAQAHSLEMLEKASDINSAEDFQRFLKKSSPVSQLYQELISILATFVTFYPPVVVLYISLFIHSSCLLRGPPSK